MADTKVSGLALAASFLTTHELPVNEAGTSKKTNGAQIIAAVAQGTAQYGSAAYAQVVANQTPVTSLTDLTSVTVTVTVASGRRVKVTAKCGMSSTVADDGLQMFIREGATTLQTCNVTARVAATDYTLTAIVVLTPTAAAHTYKVSVQRGGGSGVITMDASTQNPAFILVEDMGT